MTVCNITGDILCHIFSYLSCRDVGRVASVSRLFLRHAENEKLWTENVNVYLLSGTLNVEVYIAGYQRWAALSASNALIGLVRSKHKQVYVVLTVIATQPIFYPRGRYTNNSPTVGPRLAFPSSDRVVTDEFVVDLSAEQPFHDSSFVLDRYLSQRVSTEQGLLLIRAILYTLLCNFPQLYATYTTPPSWGHEPYCDSKMHPSYWCIRFLSNPCCGQGGGFHGQVNLEIGFTADVKPSLVMVFYEFAGFNTRDPPTQLHEAILPLDCAMISAEKHADPRYAMRLVRELVWPKLLPLYEQFMARLLERYLFRTPLYYSIEDFKKVRGFSSDSANMLELRLCSEMSLMNSSLLPAALESHLRFKGYRDGLRFCSVLDALTLSSHTLTKRSASPIAALSRCFRRVLRFLLQKEERAWVALFERMAARRDYRESVDTHLQVWVSEVFGVDFYAGALFRSMKLASHWFDGTLHHASLLVPVARKIITFVLQSSPQAASLLAANAPREDIETIVSELQELRVNLDVIRKLQTYLNPRH